ncbi:MAG TPA: hypothetical protein PLJ97_02430 [Candidatus Saccharibacteria bacterium]|nr:hypothetical protein [Candidatus Saccharibacteria bacterium]
MLKYVLGQKGTLTTRGHVMELACGGHPDQPKGLYVPKNANIGHRDTASNSSVVWRGFTKLRQKGRLQGVRA